MSKLQKVDAEPQLAWQEHADRAWKGGALQILSAALESRALASGTELGEIIRRPALDLMIGFLSCFQITPSGLPQPALEAVLGILVGVFQGALQCQYRLSHGNGQRIAQVLSSDMVMFAMSAGACMLLDNSLNCGTVSLKLCTLHISCLACWEAVLVAVPSLLQAVALCNPSLLSIP